MSLQYWEILDIDYQQEVHHPYEPPITDNSRTFQLPDAKDITLAEYDPSCQGAITAHKLADYRRRKFSLVLLPAVHIVLDSVLAPAGPLPEGGLS